MRLPEAMIATRPTPVKLYSPGTPAPFSGVYHVIHDEHRSVHSAVVIKGDKFPPCRNCHNRVRYELFAEAEYMVHHWDLSGSNPDLMN